MTAGGGEAGRCTTLFDYIGDCRLQSGGIGASNGLDNGVFLQNKEGGHSEERMSE